MSSTALGTQAKAHGTDWTVYILIFPLSTSHVLTTRLMGSKEKPFGGICRLAITALSFCVAQKASVSSSRSYPKNAYKFCSRYASIA